MKKIIGLLGLCSLLLSGCGKDSHEDIAKEFVTVVSHSEFDKAFSLVSTSGKQKLQKHMNYCHSVGREYIYELSYNFAVLMGAKADYDASKEERKYYDSLSTETRDIYNKVQNTPKKKVKEIKEKFHKKLIVEYGSEDKIPYQEKKNVKVALFEALVEPYQSRIDKMYEQILSFNKIPDERIKYPHIVKKLMGILGISFEGRKFAIHSPIADAMVNHVIGDLNMVDKVCMKKRTGILEATHIKVIEVQEKGKDKAIVRLELSDGKSEPKKVVVKLETFNDVWKVTSYSKGR